MRQLQSLLLCLIVVSYGVAIAQEVIPDFYREPGLQSNRHYVNQNHHENIDPFTGSLQHHYVDLHIPGNGGLDLKIIRSYNSASVDPANPTQPVLSSGWGWAIHFGRILKTKDNYPCFDKNTQSVADNPVLELPDGSRQLLAFTGSSSPMAITAQRWRIDCRSGGGLLVTSPDGVMYEMSQAVGPGSMTSPVYEWHTKKITDRNGNYIAINYVSGTGKEIRSISTSDGRSVSFSYWESGTTSARIRSISTGSQAYQYDYRSSGVSGVYQLSEVTRPDRTSWKYAYNGSTGSSAGGYLMSSVQYPQGGSISYSYEYVFFDSQSNPYSRSNVVSRKQTSDGGAWSFRYAPGGSGSYDETTVDSPAGNITYKHIGPLYAGPGKVWMVGLLVEKRVGSIQTEKYEWEGQKISSETYLRPGAFVTKVDYLETNAPVLKRKTITRDGATYQTTFSSFDSYGNPRQVSESGPEGGSRTTSISYYINAGKWIVKQPQDESSSGLSISRSFDSYGNMTSETRNGVTVSRSYDGEGNVSSATFPRSLRHSYSSYKRGIPQSESQPEGISISRQVSDAGNVTMERNGNGDTTNYAYDDLNRVTSIDYPVGDSVRISYSSASRTASRGGLTQSTQYDGFGRTTRVTLGGITTSYDVDTLGRTVFQSNPGTSSPGTRYSYDQLNRVVGVRYADGASRSISYGSGSKTVRDERGNNTTYSYRAYGDPDKTFLMGISTPDSGARVTFSRNSMDLITSATQGGWTRRYSYNSNGYLTSASHPETGTTSYGRDEAGNMTSRSTGGAGTVNFSYDGQNRLQRISYPGSTPSVSHSYDGAGRLLRTSTTAATRSYSYDGNGNVLEESLSANGMSWSVRYGYNSNDALTSITYPMSGTRVSYSVNSLGQPTSIQNYIQSVAYWASGQVRTIGYANGVTSEYGQNQRLWANSFSTLRSAYFNNASYGYDAAGNLTSISDSADTAYNRTLDYDSMNRLTRVTTPAGSGDIAYDGAGNITRQRIGSLQLDYRYDGSNRLSSLSAVPSTHSTSYGYDALGNIASAQGKTYQYDAVPNLTCVNCGGAGGSILYTYDGDQKRTSMTKGGIKTHEFFGVHGQLLADYTPGTSGQKGKLTEYIYLNGKRIAQKETAR